MTDLSRNLSEEIRVEVECYDKEQRKLLTDTNNYPQVVVDNVKALDKKNFYFNIADFLIYYIFYLKRDMPNRYKVRADLSHSIKRALVELDEYIEYSNYSLHVCNDVVDLPISIKERIGEAIGMGVTASINNVHEADWCTIPVLQVKALDFYLAYTAHGAIQVETKGSYVKNSAYKHGLYKHKSSIIAKKSQTRIKPLLKYPGDYLYGTIASFDKDITRVLKCWLVDPEPVKVEYDLFKSRLLTRMQNILWMLKLVSPESRVISLLTERINAISGSSDIMMLNNVRLGKNVGESMLSSDIVAEQFYYHKTYINNEDGDAGVWGEASGGRVYFLGVKRDLIKNIYEQNFEELLNYSFTPRVEQVSLECSVETEADLIEWLSVIRKGKSSQINNRFSANGELYTSQSGFIFGLLSTEQ
ncbi:TPA: hypothetical protein ACPEW4_001808 [Citrobacter braakii]